MLLDTLFEVTGSVIFLFCTLLAAAVLVSVVLYKLAIAGDNTLRKAKPYLVFLGLGALFVLGRPLLHYLANLAFGGGGDPVGGSLNASGAEIAADQLAGGWVQLGNATSKIVMAATLYVMFRIIPWLIQQYTHPEPTRWAKQDYTREYAELPPRLKFENYGKLQLNQAILAAAAIIGACLIQ